jgi:hypothetical protein
MEELIKQAFLHVEVIGPHVHEGHYDLVGPDGEIILPQVWETMVQPDWAITMHMWPMPEPPPPPPEVVQLPPTQHAGPTGKKPKKQGKKRESAHMSIPPPPPMVMFDPGPPPPPPPAPLAPAAHPMMGAPIEILNPTPSVAGSRPRTKKAAPSGFMKWAAGGGGSGRSSSVKKAKKPSS